MPCDLVTFLDLCGVTACPMASFICFCIHVGSNQSPLLPFEGTVTSAVDFFFVAAGLLATLACMAFKFDFPRLAVCFSARRRATLDLFVIASLARWIRDLWELSHDFGYHFLTPGCTTHLV